MKPVTIAIVSLSLFAASQPSATAAELLAGVARVDITPPLEMKPALGGYGERMNKPAEGVHDRIFAKALVLSSAGKRFAVVTADALGFPPPLKPAIVEALASAGWKSEQILLLPSHSHTAIEMNSIHPGNKLNIPQIGLFNPKVYELTVANFVKVISDASRRLVPVSVGTTSMQLPGWNRNRRGDTFSDLELITTRVDQTTGEPLAVLVNWTAHPTFMGANDMWFSGDWPGHLQRTVEALIGRGATVMYYNGAEGDQSPASRPDSGGNYERAERYGRELGIIVWREWEKIKPTAAPIFDYRTTSFDLPKATWHPDFMKTGGAEYGLNEQNMPVLLDMLLPKKTHTTALRLGDLVIVGIPGEMAAGLGVQIKTQARQATGAERVAIGGLADEWISYMLAPEQYRKGGYEASVSFYGATLGPLVVEAAAKNASQLPKSRPGDALGRRRAAGGS